MYIVISLIVFVKNYEIAHERKFWTQEILTRKNLRPTKYSQKISWEPQNTLKKIETYEIPATKIFGPTKYPREKVWTHKIATKIFGPTKLR